MSTNTPKKRRTKQKKDEPEPLDVTCPECDGACEMEDDDGRTRICRRCGGTGLIPNE